MLSIFFLLMMRIKFKCPFYFILSPFSVLGLTHTFSTPPTLLSCPLLYLLPTVPHHDNCNQRLLCVNIPSLLLFANTFHSWNFLALQTDIPTAKRRRECRVFIARCLAQAIGYFLMSVIPKLALLRACEHQRLLFCFFRKV